MKIDPVGVLGKSASIPSISDYHPTIDIPKTTSSSEGTFDVHTDKAKVSALPTFSISSLLNQEIPGNVKGSDRVLNKNLEKEVSNAGMDVADSTSAKLPVTSTVMGANPKDSTSTGETDSANYLEASRVLGAVFNKVKDPLARKSVEVAIKAMLKLMKSENAYSKKHSVPSMKKSLVLQEKIKKLMKTIHELSETVHAVDEEVSSSKKKHWHSKSRFFNKRLSQRHTIRNRPPHIHRHHHPHHPHHHHYHKRTYSKYHVRDSLKSF